MDPVKVRKFAIYTAVNIAASAVDFSSFVVLTRLFGAPTLQSVAAYLTSMFTNYGLQRRFVFVGNVSGKSEYRVFLEFAGTGMFGLASTALVIWLGVDVMNLSPVVSKTLAMLVCFVVLYIARNHFVFNNQANNRVSAPTNAGPWEGVPAVVIGYNSRPTRNRLQLDDGAGDAVGFFVLCFSALVSFGAY